MPELPYRTYPGWAIVVAAIFIIAMVAREASSILAPLLLALVFAITATPLVDALARRGTGRGLAIVLVMFSLAILIGGVAVLVAGSFEQLSQKTGAIEAQVDAALATLRDTLAGAGIKLPATTPDASFGADAAGPMINAILGGLASLAGNMFLFLFAAIFMLIEVPGARRAIGDAEAKSGRSFATIQRLAMDVRHYMGLKTLTSLANATLIMIWLAVAGVPFVLLWGVLSFLTYFIPNIGIAIPAFAASVVALAQNGLVNALLTGLGFVVASTLMGNIVEPRIFGRGLGLSMSWVFISLIVWGWILGPIGMLLAVPLTMVVKRLLEASEDTRWLARFLGRLDDTGSGGLSPPAP